MNCNGCSKELTSIKKLACPQCNLYFCSQDCFKQNWKIHKISHTLGYKYTGRLRPHPLVEKSQRKIPDNIMLPDYANVLSGISKSEELVKHSTSINILKKEEIDGVRKACKIAREVLNLTAKNIRVGITTDELDRIAHNAIIERGAYPSPLNYYGFPKSICTSVNEVVCHGIPDGRPLEDGDIINLDVTVYYNGFHGDLNETYTVGDNVDQRALHLISTAKRCLEDAISICKPGVRYRQIGDVIQKIANESGFSVAKSYGGHGIGKLFHCAPQIPHYSPNKAIGIMRPGHIFTIEPMINEGTWRDVVWPDKWTVVTEDGKLSAQFEHTLLITDNGVEILTI